MEHYFILNDQHEPVEVDIKTFCLWKKDIADTTVAEDTRVWTRFEGITSDGGSRKEPRFVHYVFEPGFLYRTASTYGYHEAVARHGRIVDWLTKRAELRARRAAAIKASPSR